MEQNMGHERSFPVPSQTTAGKKRYWSLSEEKVLVGALKDLVLGGYMCDNGFKTGYLLLLEQAMCKAFPGRDLKSEPNISSKVHVWKKNYNSISGMLGTSGIGWNDSSNTIEVHSEQVWEEYVKVYKVLQIDRARTMRNKSWTHFKHWIEIYGKDRATGENVQAFPDAVQDLLNRNNEKENENGGEHVPTFHHNEYTETSPMSSTRGDSNASGSKSSRKRKSIDASDDAFIELMKAFCDKTDSRLGEIAKRIGFEHEASKSRKVVFEALGNMNNLDEEDKIMVSKFLVSDIKNLDFFFSLPDGSRATMVKMILERLNDKMEKGAVNVSIIMCDNVWVRFGGHVLYKSGFLPGIQAETEQWN
ncbi:hypothetical protein BUALT_Bualt04G0021600 [Buddleja alternifolia]|uniref:Myb/SANT-like domain-containing protein n=1 Tax=Buddleja alternifolia TaxID=168488 RepID=A0AAV6XKH2_9LAMI|nr:hypothetical protein BUALT_Bualt04G0021600 [Buddleja alternifolia]